ncbi:MAG: LCP family protein [Actinomycetota bacterium]|nr:LCP family protein [Actinomycetota bacterium]
MTQPPIRLPPELDPRAPSAPPASSTAPGRRRSRQPRWVRWLRVTAAVTSIGILLVSCGGYVAYRYYNGRLGHVSIRLPGQGAPADSDGPAQDFLLVGSDTRDFTGGEAFQAKPGSADYVSGQRSDTVMLVHLPPGNAKATLVSFPRDSYVQIPAHPDDKGHPQAPYMAKLNEAFAVGGPALLVQLIENLSGLRIDHYVAVDFGGFKKMVDALGGVTLCVNTTRRDRDSGDFLTKGVHPDVSGDVALSFVRDRKGLQNGDLDRIKDQQYFLAQMLRRVTSAGTLANPLKLNAFLTAATGDVTVDKDLGPANVRTLATRLRHLDPAHVTFETIPITTDSATRPIHGIEQSVVLIDQAKAGAMFGALRNDANVAGPAPTSSPASPTPLLVSPAQVPVSVLNGSGRPRQAALAAAELRKAGFLVVRVGNSVSSEHTVVRYGNGREEAARTLAAAVPGSSLVADASLTETLALVVGADFSAVRALPPAAPPAPAPAAPDPPGAVPADQVSCAP